MRLGHLFFCQARKARRYLSKRQAVLPPARFCVAPRSRPPACGAWAPFTPRHGPHAGLGGREGAWRGPRARRAPSHAPYTPPTPLPRPLHAPDAPSHAPYTPPTPLPRPLHAPDAPFTPPARGRGEFHGGSWRVSRGSWPQNTPHTRVAFSHAPLHDPRERAAIGPCRGVRGATAPAPRIRVTRPLTRPSRPPHAPRGPAVCTDERWQSTTANLCTLVSSRQR